MKKIFSIIALGTLVLAGCAKFQDEKLPEFAPAAEPVISEVSFDDYSLSATVTAAEGTDYFSWAIIAGSADVDANNLLATNVKSAIVKGISKAEKEPSVSFTAENLNPNTEYTVYAVASNKQGVVSKVVSVTKTTSDSTIPSLKSMDSEVEGSSMLIWIGFNEEVTLTGAGSVTASFFAINSDADENGNLSPAYEVSVPVETLIEDGKWIGIPIPEEAYQPGAFVFVTYSEGIVKNAVGLENAAYKNHVCTSEGPLKGICEQYAEVEWGLAFGEYTAAGFVPYADTTVFFNDWEGVQFLVGPDAQAIEDGVIMADGSLSYTITYTQASGRAISYPSSPAGYFAKGGFFYGYLAEAPAYGATISFSIPEECLYDIWGNPSAALEAEDLYFCSYGLGLEDITGTYKFYVEEYYGGPVNDYLEEDIIIAPYEYAKDESVNIAIYGIGTNTPVMGSYFKPFAPKPIPGVFDGDSGVASFYISMIGIYGGSYYVGLQTYDSESLNFYYEEPGVYNTGAGMMFEAYNSSYTDLGYISYYVGYLVKVSDDCTLPAQEASSANVPFAPKAGHVTTHFEL